MQSRDEKPSIEEVKSYFHSQNFPKLEANKFFNYFTSIGWLVGGKTPMVDWKASANNWMLNAPNFISNAAFKALLSQISMVHRNLRINSGF